MKITFIKEPKPQSLGPDDVFVVGETYDLKDKSAERWINRGVAEIAKEVVKKVAKKAPKKVI